MQNLFILILKNKSHCFTSKLRQELFLLPGLHLLHQSQETMKMKILFYFSLFNMSPNLLWKKWLKILLSTCGGGAQHSSPVLHNVFCGSCKRHINPHNGQIPFLSYCSHISLKPFCRVKPLPLWCDSWGNQEEEILSNRCGVNKKSSPLQWVSASKWLSIILQIHKMHSGTSYCQISLPHTDWISLRDPNERKEQQNK